MIDINELRRLAQEAMHPVTKGRWMHLFGESTVYDRLEDGCRGIPVVSTPFSPSLPFEAACLDFIAAANPAAVSELLDRLEAAEKAVNEAYQRGYETGQEEIAAEHDALRAKIEAMERLITWVKDEYRLYPDSLDEKAFADRLLAAITHPKFGLQGAKGEEK